MMEEITSTKDEKIIEEKKDDLTFPILEMQEITNYSPILQANTGISSTSKYQTRNKRKTFVNNYQDDKPLEGDSMGINMEENLDDNPESKTKL